jgi:hypothetical protein
MPKKRRKRNWSYNAGERGRNWVRAYQPKRDGRFYLEWMEAFAFDEAPPIPTMHGVQRFVAGWSPSGR